MARTTEWKIEMTRRALLRLGLTGAAMAALPFPFHRSARADAGDPHLIVTLYADGGWDTTQVLDVHDPADTTDGIDVDVPGQPVSQIATAGPLTYISNPVTRPNVDVFFQHWASRTAIVNGINTRSTSHDQSRQLMATGYLDPTRADFAVMAAAANGPSLPLPHILLSGPSWGGPFAGLSGRVGGQLSEALAYDQLGEGGPLLRRAGTRRSARPPRGRAPQHQPKQPDAACERHRRRLPPGAHHERHAEPGGRLRHAYRQHAAGQPLEFAVRLPRCVSHPARGGAGPRALEPSRRDHRHLLLGVRPHPGAERQHATREGPSPVDVGHGDRQERRPRGLRSDRRHAGRRQDELQDGQA